MNVQGHSIGSIDHGYPAGIQRASKGLPMGFRWALSTLPMCLRRADFTLPIGCYPWVAHGLLRWLPVGCPRCDIIMGCADISIRKADNVGLPFLIRTCTCSRRARVLVLGYCPLETGLRRRVVQDCHANSIQYLYVLVVGPSSPYSGPSGEIILGRSITARRRNAGDAQVTATGARGGSKPSLSLDGAIVCCFRDFCSVRLQLFLSHYGSSSQPNPNHSSQTFELS